MPTLVSRTTRTIAALTVRVLAAFPPLTATMKATPIVRSRTVARRDVAIALLWSIICHSLFAGAVVSMIGAMWFGMSRSLGSVPQPWTWMVNFFLLAQFAVLHSLFLTPRGGSIIERLAPSGTGRTLATTTFATIASVQLLALFVLWTPSGIIWWEASGSGRLLMGCLYALSWLLLIKASWDAGAEVQSALLGWMSLLRGVKPQFPPMPTKGLFKVVRQPIYVAFALTTWCVPTWTPDQLLVAIVLTAYCLLGPLAKEKRFALMFGQDWQRYRAAHPYWLPGSFAPFGKASTSTVDPSGVAKRSQSKTRLGASARAPTKPVPRKANSA